MSEAKVKKPRHASTNYRQVRQQLKGLIEFCETKLEKKGGRVNPKPLREKLVEIRKMIRDGSYDSK